MLLRPALIKIYIEAHRKFNSLPASAPIGGYKLTNIMQHLSTPPKHLNGCQYQKNPYLNRKEKRSRQVTFDAHSSLGKKRTRVHENDSIRICTSAVHYPCSLKQEPQTLKR